MQALLDITPAPGQITSNNKDLAVDTPLASPQTDTHAGHPIRPPGLTAMRLHRHHIATATSLALSLIAGCGGGTTSGPSTAANTDPASDSAAAAPATSLDNWLVGKSVQAANGAPIALLDRYSTGVGKQLLVYTKDGVLANDGGQAIHGWQARLVAAPTRGAFVLNADGSFGYLPNAGYEGYDYFQYQAFDGTNTSAVVSVEIAVGTVSSTSTGTGGTATASGSTSTGSTSSSTSTGSTTTSSTTTSTTSSGTSGGGGATTGTSSTGSTSTASTSTSSTTTSPSSTTTSASSSTGSCPSSTLAVQADQYTTAAGAQLLVYTPSGVLANDGGTSSQGWSATLVRGPQNGQFAFNPDGSFGYIPRAGFVGVDAFEYQARFNGQMSTPVTVSLLVGGATMASAAPCSTSTTSSASSSSTTGSGTTSSGTSGSTSSATSSATTGTSSGSTSTTNTTPSSTSTTPPPNGGTTSSNAGSTTNASALVTNPDIYVTGIGQQLLVYQNDGPLKNDGGQWNQGWTVQLLMAPSQGAFALNADGSFGYVPPPGFVGTTTFAYQASYAGKTSAPTTVTIYVGQTPTNTGSATGGSVVTVPTQVSNDSVLLIAGQSNSAGFQCSMCSTGFLTPLYNGTRMSFLNDPYAMRAPSNPHPPLGNTSWTQYTDLAGGVLPIQDGTQRSFWPWVYERLLTGNSKTIRSINIGVGGTIASQWADPYYLNRRFDYAQAAPKVDYVLWVHGEGDAAMATSTAAYKLAMRQIKYAADVRSFAHLSTKPKWILFRSTGGLPLAVETNPGPRIQIRQAMAELAAESPNEFVLGPDLDALPRSLHFDTDQQFESAVAATTAYLRGLGL